MGGFFETDKMKKHVASCSVCRRRTPERTSGTWNAATSTATCSTT